MAIFPYHQEPVSNWSKKIADKKLSGTQCLTVPVLWSHHESTQGMRDFSRSTRHRLERVLQYATEHQITVQIETGFQNFLNNTPQWAQHVSKNALDSVRSLVPKNVLLQQSSLTELTEIPSIHDRNFKQSWYGFLEELFIVCGLYTEPENTVQKIEIDLRIFETDQGLLHTPGFASALKARYEGHAQLNMLYGTTFKSFEQVATPAAFKVLMDKRPWNAFYDYQWCRQWLLKKTEAEIRLLPSAFPLRQLIHFTHDKIEAKKTTAIFMDNILFETHQESGRPIPFICSPDGLIHAQSVYSMQIYKELSSQGACSLVDFHFLKAATPIDENVLKKYPVVTCLATKFLDRMWAEGFQKYLQNGGQVLFLAGIPQFDENLLPIHWKWEVKKSPELDNLHTKNLGKGSAYLPKDPIDMSSDIWQSFSHWIEQIESRQERISAC